MFLSNNNDNDDIVQKAKTFFKKMILNVDNSANLEKISNCLKNKSNNNLYSLYYNIKVLILKVFFIFC